MQKKEFPFLEKIYDEIIEKVKDTDTIGHYTMKTYRNGTIVEKGENNEKITIITLSWTKGKKNLIVSVYAKDEMGEIINRTLQKYITSTKNIRTSSNADYIVYGFP